VVAAANACKYADNMRRLMTRRITWRRLLDVEEAVKHSEEKELNNSDNATAAYGG
jgi:hypothetical protein